MRSLLVTGLCLLGASLAYGAPAPPVVTVGASNIKQLQFDWDPVPQTNYYELWFKANAGAQWVKYAETPAQRPRFRIGVSVHLLDWRAARYREKACNPSGCATSAEVGVNGLALDAMGYIKPNAATGVNHFGHAVALSADGRTLATLARETIDGRPGSVAVHVYRRTSSSAGWYREARLVPSVVREQTSEPVEGSPLALSADGSVLALGVFTENFIEINPRFRDSGAVYLFQRSGTTWRETQRLAGQQQRDRDQFGYVVDLDDAGRTLAVVHQYMGLRIGRGTVEIYRRAGANVLFAQSETVPVPVVDGGPAECRSTTLSGDGNTLARVCIGGALSQRFVQVFTGPGWNETARIFEGFWEDADLSYDGTRLLTVTGSGGAVYELGAAGWERRAILSFPDGIIFQHRRAAISRDGNIVVGGGSMDNFTGGGVGPIYPPYIPAEPPSGSAYVYDRRASGWFLRRVIKPGSTNVQRFGHSVALGDDGKVLAVGAFLDGSDARGIDGNPHDDSAPERGAVWVY